MRNRQVGPDDAADVLAEVVREVKYKNWSFELSEIDRGQGCQGLTLVITATVPDSFGDGEVTFAHLMPVLPANYDRQSWIGWVFEQILMVESHEAMEFFEVAGQKVYFPDHAPGRNPYTRALVKSKEQAFSPAVPWTGGPATNEHFA